MTIKQRGGIFGRNPAFNEVAVGNDIAKLTQNGTNAFLDTEKFRIRAPDGSLIGLQYNPDDSGRIQLRYGGNTKLQTTGTGVSVTGNVAVSDGNGIDFSATAGTGTSELFDDYEEGEWTPAVADASSGGNEASLGTVDAFYTKIGRQVTLVLGINNIDTTGLTAGSDVFITGLPFTPSAYPGSVKNTAAVTSAFITFAGFITATAIDGQAYIRLHENVSNALTDYVRVSEIASGTADLSFTLTYFTG